MFETLRISVATFFQCVASMEAAGWALWDIWPDDCLYVTRLDGRVMLHKGKGFGDEEVRGKVGNALILGPYQTPKPANDPAGRRTDYPDTRT